MQSSCFVLSEHHIGCCVVPTGLQQSMCILAMAGMCTHETVESTCDHNTVTDVTSVAYCACQAQLVPQQISMSYDCLPLRSHHHLEACVCQPLMQKQKHVTT